MAVIDGSRIEKLRVAWAADLVFTYTGPADRTRHTAPGVQYFACLWCRSRFSWGILPPPGSPQHCVMARPSRPRR